jgi:hypothetical protein
VVGFVFSTLVEAVFLMGEVVVFPCLFCSNSRWFGSTQTSTRWSAMGHRGLATGTPSAGRKQLGLRR